MNMNEIDATKPFTVQWQGMKMTAYIEEVEATQCFGEPPRIKLTCILDNHLTEIYNQNNRKEEYMDFGNTVMLKTLHESWSNPVVYKYETKFFDEEENMSLVKKYVNKSRDKKEQKAIEKGLIGEDGVLTCEGKALLLQILLDDKEIRNKFFNAVEELSEDEEK